MQTVIMYSTHCPRCKVLATKLKEKKIDYVENTNVEDMKKLGITSVPVLEVNKELYTFIEAINWVKEQ